MRRFIICLLSTIILYLLQVSLFAGPLRIAGITPNLILLFTCVVGFMRGRRSGIFTGFFGGLLVDIMSNKIIGITALFYMYAGFFNGLFHKEYSKDQSLFPVLLVGLCDFAYGIVFYIANFLLRNRLSFGYYLGNVIFPEMIYTVVLSIFAYVFVFFINKKLEAYDRRHKRIGNGNGSTDEVVK